MTERPPSFTGYVPAESVIKFIEDLEIYNAIRQFTNIAKLNVLGVVLRGPAKIAYDAALVPGVPGGIVAGAGADAQAIAGGTYNNAIAYLRATYHTADIQQSLRDQLTTMYQGMNESPLTFYTKIRHAVGLAGYAAALIDQVVEQAFMNGLHKELALQVRSSPMVLTLLQKVDYAQRYWAACNPGMDVMQQILLNSLYER